MGRLSGFRYRVIIQILKKFGFEFHRQAAESHEIWYNKHTNRYATIPSHSGDMPEGTPRAILKQADIEPDDFLKKHKSYDKNPTPPHRIRQPQPPLQPRL